MSISIPKTSGIYVIKCEKNGKIYVGSTSNLRKRWKEHFNGLNANSHRNSYLQNAWNKYGEQHFIFRILEFCAIEYLEEREQHWLDILRPYDRNIGFNISIDATASRRGISPTLEARSKMRTAKLGKTPSPESIEKTASANRGRKMPLEAVEKSRDAKRKMYIITYPDGSEETVKGLDRFARQNGLRQQSLTAVARGNRKSHKGYRIRHVESTDSTSS